MTLNRFRVKATQLLYRKFVYLFFQYPRVLKFKFLSTCNHVNGNPKINQPVHILGKGSVEFANRVTLGVNPSPFLYSGYIYIDARSENSKITIGEGVWINNNCVLISEGDGIEIGRNTLIGSNVEILDSDFHDLNPENRVGGVAKTAKVVIGVNTFIGANVKILKGVKIGDNSVIGNGSIVTNNIPENVIALGTPAKVIKKL